MNQLSPHHSELPSTAIEAYLNSSVFLSNQLEWAALRVKVTKKDTEEYTQCLEDLRKAETAYDNYWGVCII